MIEAALELVATWGGLAVRWVWQGTLLALPLFVATPLLRRSGPRVRLALLSLALLRFAIPPLASPIGGLDLPMAWTGPPEDGLELFVADGRGTTALIWPAWVLVAYLAGALLAALRLVAQTAALRRLRTGADPAPAAIQRKVRSLAARLRLRRHPEVVVSDRVGVPFIFGVHRPVIVLPRRVAAELSERDLRHVLAHELLHQRGGDLVLNVVVAVLGVLWWFHPLFRWVARELAETREELCDDAVLRELDTRPSRYARALLQTAVVCGPMPAAPGAAALFSPGGHPLEHRLKYLGRPCPRRRPVRPLIALAWLVGGLLILGSTGGAKASSQPRSIVFVHQGGTAPDAETHPSHSHSH